MPELEGFFEGTGMPDPGWWEALWSDPARVLTDVGVTSGMDVVDLCAGDGWFTLKIAKIALHVFAIDIDGKLLEIAKRRLEESGIKNCVFVEGNAYDIAEYVRVPVDMVFLANAFHGVPDKSRLAGAVYSVLKPGGRFVVVNWHARAREQTTVLGIARGPATQQRMTPDETTAAVSASGLKLHGVIDLAPYHYAAIFERPRATTSGSTRPTSAMVPRNSTR
jgi:SAM-dependent methyltransferase